ncbi:OsmC family protein [Planococcus soli]|uniref:OsmC family protein n=1 Tax=Planococcus soli TaxID=2666072 RepID=UPI00115CDF67|nr:OsmC family protein [Planococcus soli]
METDQLILNTKWQGDFVFSAVGQGGHSLTMDAHQGVGKEQGLLPMQALLGSLAGCVGMDVIMILRSKTEEIRSLEIITEGIKRRNPPKEFLSFVVTFVVEGEIAAEQVLHAIEVSGEKYCPVAHSLKADVRYRLVLNGEEASAT